jgi:hypothetical protein
MGETLEKLRTDLATVADEGDAAAREIEGSPTEEQV